VASSGAHSFWSLDELPKETRGYVPTFYATLIIASDPANYGFKLGTDTTGDTRRVEVDGPLSLKYLAAAANGDEDVARDMNPAYRRGVLPPGRSPVRLPSRAAETIANRTATLKNEDADIAICSFRMREGDSVKKLAMALGTNADTIMAMNNLRSAR